MRSGFQKIGGEIQDTAPRTVAQEFRKTTKRRALVSRPKPDAFCWQWSNGTTLWALCIQSSAHTWHA